MEDPFAFPVWVNANSEEEPPLLSRRQAIERGVWLFGALVIGKVFGFGDLKEKPPTPFSNNRNTATPDYLTFNYTNPSEEHSPSELREYINRIDHETLGVSPERLQEVLYELIEYDEAHEEVRFTPQGIAAYAAHGIRESRFKNTAVGDGGKAKWWFQYHGGRQNGMDDPHSDEDQVEHSIFDMRRDSDHMQNYDMLAAMQDTNMSLEEVVTEGYKWLRPRKWINGEISQEEGGETWAIAEAIYEDMTR